MMKKLFSHEDGRFFHAHKILGVCALASFAYRAVAWFMTGATGLGNNWQTYATMMVHALLHVSSFQFVLSDRRNRVYNIIWPEMRWHTAIFGARSILAMLLILTGGGQVYRTVLVFATMLAADLVSACLGDKNNTTMRGNPFPAFVQPWLRTGLNRFYSVSQAGATMIVMGSLNIDSVYFLLIPIQTAPFLMTLERKGFIGQMGWHVGYVAALLFVYAHDILALRQSVFDRIDTAVIMAAFLVMRIWCGIGKYLFWLAVAIYADLTLIV